MKRITPFNIVVAILLIWLGFSILDNRADWVTVLEGLLLVLICVIGDQLIRITLGSLKRIWIMQTLIVVLGMIGAFAIWYSKI